MQLSCCMRSGGTASVDKLLEGGKCTVLRSSCASRSSYHSRCAALARVIDWVTTPAKPLMSVAAHAQVIMVGVQR